MITKMVDFKSEESVFIWLSAVWQENKIMVKTFNIRRIFVKSGEQEVVAQIRSLLIKLGGLECLGFT